MEVLVIIFGLCSKFVVSLASLQYKFDIKSSGLEGDCQNTHPSHINGEQNLHGLKQKFEQAQLQQKIPSVRFQYGSKYMLKLLKNK